MCIRDFNKAAELFLASIATFTCYELFSYQTFIFYTCVTCVVALDRVTLKSKVRCFTSRPLSSHTLQQPNSPPLKPESCGFECEKNRSDGLYIYLYRIRKWPIKLHLRTIRPQSRGVKMFY
jgi:hypothetical protein